MLAISTACSSGGDDGDGNKGGTSSNGTGGTNNPATGGTNNPTTGGTNNPTTGGTNNPTTGGTSTGGTSTGGSSTGGTGGTGSAITGVCAESDKGTVALDLGQAYVDNFETATRFTGWYSYAAVPTPPAVALTRDAAGYMTATAAHIANTGINTGTDKFGSGVGFNMRNAAEACADVSAFDGVSFWAKGTSGASGTVNFLTVVASQQLEPAGDCTKAMETAGNCYKHPQKSFMLTADWKHFTIKWTDVEPQALFASRVLLALQWISTGPDFDFTIDEVTLYKGTAPEGPITDPAGAGGSGGTGGSSGGSGGTGGSSGGSGGSGGTGGTQ